MFDDAAQLSRVTARDRLDRLWSALPAVLQTALAAASAWTVAREVVGHAHPFVAPVSAIIALGITYGQRTRRSIEIAFGVAVGVLISDLITLALGSGPLQIALVIALAMSAAIVLGGSRLVVTQAATSAVLVATVAVPDHVTLARFVDALTGGGIALLVNLVLFPVNPVRLARRASTPLLVELPAVLRDIAKGLEDGEHDAGVDALARARALDDLSARFGEATQTGSEVVALSPIRRRHADELRRYATAAEHIELAVRNVRVLARGAVRAIDLEANVPPESIAALRDLAAAFVALAPSLDDPQRAERAREHALVAAGRATLGLERTANLSASVIVGQIRSTATDLLRGLGESNADAIDDVRHAAHDIAEAELHGDEDDAGERGADAGQLHP
jgi:uncharacterized membrane protein YgaE (UPF0421/DUF939 family)